jgi:hypothetical protein
MRATIGRNDPCPCGIGKKYKNCCAGQTRWTDTRISGIRTPVVLAIAVVLVGIVAGVAYMSRSDRTGPAASSGQVAPLSAAPSGPTPAAWTYDSTTNQHWDPAHNHWHEGPPPAGAGTSSPGGVAAPTLPGAPGAGGATPAPYQYDATTNRYWDPAHGHWHDGPPPTTPTR